MQAPVRRSLAPWHGWMRSSSCPGVMCDGCVAAAPRWLAGVLACEARAGLRGVCCVCGIGLTNMACTRGCRSGCGRHPCGGPLCTTGGGHSHAHTRPGIWTHRGPLTGERRPIHPTTFPPLRLRAMQRQRHMPRRRTVPVPSPRGGTQWRLARAKVCYAYIDPPP